MAKGVFFTVRVLVPKLKVTFGYFCYSSLGNNTNEIRELDKSLV